ncbi:hypothetical protein [Pseudoalteromonas sp. OOF1S-7]|uniref:WD40 repeat domain-containing protein n=1 Tax=Pseudoalteromonas sp. OOF1S-7 TaxID=2917757 RepID=UPI001EF457CD|nr:hypothetical protein [Pseudoalteromonas sp. OOF1S-7]MCG7534079.1 hypothetical protein [Pseudoalteromonas sp. OOF1S-7]
MWLRGMLVLICVLVLSACNEEIQLSKGNVGRLNDSGIVMGHFSKDGTKLVTFDNQKQIQVWDVATQQTEFTVPEDKTPEFVRDIALSEDLQMLVIASETELAFWSLSKGKLVTKVAFGGVTPGAVITAMAISPKNDKAIVAMADGTINMADLHTQINNRFAPHSRPVQHVFWDDKGELFVTGAQDGKLALWKFGSAEPIFMKEFDHRVTSVAVRDDFSALFASDALNEQVVTSLADGQSISELQYMSRFKVFRKALFIKGSKLLATSSSKSHLSIWNTQSGEELGTWQISFIHDGATIVDMYAADNHTLLTLSSDGILEAWTLNALAQR